MIFSTALVPAFTDPATVPGCSFCPPLSLAAHYVRHCAHARMHTAEHSQRCYQYYLDNLDPTDTSVLTRLGNLLGEKFDWVHVCM